MLVSHSIKKTFKDKGTEMGDNPQTEDKQEFSVNENTMKTNKITI